MSHSTKLGNYHCHVTEVPPYGIYLESAEIGRVLVLIIKQPCTPAPDLAALYPVGSVYNVAVFDMKKEWRYEYRPGVLTEAAIDAEEGADLFAIDSEERTAMPVFLRLLDEGVDVWRPVPAKHIEDNVFEIQTDDGALDEHWEFEPNTKVFCEVRMIGAYNQVVAVRRA